MLFRLIYTILTYITFTITKYKQKYEGKQRNKGIISKVDSSNQNFHNINQCLKIPENVRYTAAKNVFFQTEDVTGERLCWKSAMT